MLKISSDSTEYLWIGVNSTKPDGTEVNVSNEIVSIAVSIGEPIEADWHTAEWDGSSERAGKMFYYAKLLIGPNGVPYTEGIYRVTARVGSTEKIIPGGLQIT